MSRTYLLLPAALALASACEAPEPAARGLDEAAFMGATVERVVQNPAVYAGKVVTVSGEVEKIHGDRVFTVGGGDFLFEERLLVVSPRPLPRVPERREAPLLSRDDIVQVTGVVRPLVVAEIERELGWDLQPELEVEFQGAPVLVARSIDVTPRRPAASAARAAERTAPADPTTPRKPFDDLEAIPAPGEPAPVVGGNGAAGPPPAPTPPAQPPVPEAN